MAIEKKLNGIPQVYFSQEEIWLDFAFLRVNKYNIRGTVPHITAGKGWWNSSADLPGWGNSSGNTPRPSGTCLTCPWKYMSGETRASATLPLEMPLNILLASSTLYMYSYCTEICIFGCDDEFFVIQTSHTHSVIWPVIERQNCGCYCTCYHIEKLITRRLNSVVCTRRFVRK